MAACRQDAACNEGYSARHFYSRFNAIRVLLLSSIEGIDAETDRVYYASLMLNRLLFGYFLQKRGLLNGDVDYLPNQMKLTQQSLGQNTFYRQILLPLCHELSDMQHPHAYDTLLRKSPMLPIRLLQPHALELANISIHIPDDAFAQIFSFFETYQWCLDAQPPQSSQEIHPDILSYLFEQHTDHKQMGAYYTREDVTSYIAENTIVPYLLTTVASRCPTAFAADAAPWRLLQRDAERYIHPSARSTTYLPMETEREYVARLARYKELVALVRAENVRTIAELIPYNLNLLQLLQDTIAQTDHTDVLYAFYTCIEQISILDPTCGSGAFLFTALHILKKLYTLCLDRMQVLVSNHERNGFNPCLDVLSRAALHTDRDHFILTSIITNNLYGVDIMEDAVEVCKQRLVLMLLAHTDLKDDLIPLSTLNANFRTGNALMGSVYDKELEGFIEGQRRYFHWSVAFPHIMERGGFDVIIGNPPYIEYSKVRHDYISHSDEMAHCGNLYAAVIERSLALCRAGYSYLGLVVPLSICSGKRFDHLRSIIMQHTSLLCLANFEIFPSRLFDGAFQRLSILLARHDTQQPCSIYTTKIQRWYAQERPHLIDTTAYTQAHRVVRPSSFPKLASPLQEDFLQKIAAMSERKTIATLLSAQKTAHLVYYQEATNYWTKATCHIPFYKKNGNMMMPAHGRVLFFADAGFARTVMTIMNSSLFYAWFAIYSDGFHLSHALVRDFPLDLSLCSSQTLLALSLDLEACIKQYARMSTRNTKRGDLIEIEEYRMGRCKPLLDEIDYTLSKHYGLSEAALDFIINFDIKYRMGRQDREEEKMQACLMQERDNSDAP